MTSILSQDFGNDQHAISESLNTEPGSAFHLLHGLFQSHVNGHFVRTCTGNSTSVIKSVFDSTKTISDRILHLSEGVLVSSTQQNGHRSGVLALLNEGKLVLTKDMFINNTSITKAGLVQLVKGIMAWPPQAKVILSIFL